MYADLKRSEKLFIARKFYLHLNSEYSKGTIGLPMSKWLKILLKLNEDYDISECLMWDTSYRSIFDILLKHYHVFEISDYNTKPYLYDIINNDIILEEFNIDV
tara:strand:- start:49 stop:357 length:309 start_codon:yes stop_codon:yes gene_type:complete